jgi:hypothetical protein
MIAAILVACGIEVDKRQQGESEITHLNWDLRCMVSEGEASASYEAEAELVSVLGPGAFFAETVLGAAVFCAALFAGAAFLSAFLNFAQRARCAAATFSRPAALMVRRFDGLSANSAGLKLVALPGSATAAGRPRFRLPVGLIPIKRAFAC